MIFVDRSVVPFPEVLEAPRVERYWREAVEFYRRDPASRAQERFRSKTQPWKRAEKDLLALFHHKCAFCERRVDENQGSHIEHFRPKSHAVNLEGAASPDHYWWLAHIWENLYIACPECNMTKGTRFPVLRERLSPPIDPSPALSRRPEPPWSGGELAYLLDPCQDRPEEFLRFFTDGTVAAVPVEELPEFGRVFGKPTRGQVTIDVLGLNRRELIEERQIHAERFLALGEQDASALLEDPSTPFLGMLRQLAAGVDEADARTKSIQDEYEHGALSFSVEVDDAEEQYFARANYITRVAVKGIGHMHDFQFDFTPRGESDGEGLPWLMILGENGAGKTTLLRAIALALIGRTRLETLQEAGKLGNILGLFQPGATVTVQLSSQQEPLVVRRQDDRLIHEGGAQAKAILRAFGPSRWFPLPDSQHVERDEFVRVRNLFDPFVPLTPAEGFLRGLKRGGQWDDVAAGLKDLLGLGQKGKIHRPKTGIELRRPGHQPKKLDRLSSGYESVLAMAADLTELLFTRWGELPTAEGIVLLDEIDAHLHPRWKMRIVGSLRRMFPRVQFIASTHEPLCLRGMRAGEILVMRKDEEDPEKVVPVRPTQSVDELRVDQILTSRMFGLESTLDPDYEEDLEHYYRLLARHPSARTPEEQKKLEKLEATVGATGILGSTRRDQLIYRAIDEFVAVEPTLPEAQRKERERLTIEEVHRFWADVGDAPEVKE